MQAASTTDARISKLFGDPAPRSAPIGTSPTDIAFAWTDDRVALLKRLWREGQTAQTIATELGDGVTRCGVLGKIHRLGLSRTQVAERARLAKRPSPRAEREPPLAPAGRAVATPPASAAEKTTNIPMSGERSVPASAGTAQRPPTPLRAEPRPDRSVALSDLKPHHCRWPVDVANGPILYCGAPKADRPQGSLPCSYCAQHADLAYAPRRTEAQLRGDEARRKLAIARKVPARVLGEVRA